MRRSTRRKYRTMNLGRLSSAFKHNHRDKVLLVLIVSKSGKIPLISTVFTLTVWPSAFDFGLSSLDYWRSSLTLRFHSRLLALNSKPVTCGSRLWLLTHGSQLLTLAFSLFTLTFGLRLDSGISLDSDSRLLTLGSRFSTLTFCLLALDFWLSVRQDSIAVVQPWCNKCMGKGLCNGAGQWGMKRGEVLEVVQGKFGYWKERLGSTITSELRTSEAVWIRQPLVIRRSPTFWGQWLGPALQAWPLLLLSLSRLVVINVFMAWRQLTIDCGGSWEDGSSRGHEMSCEQTVAALCWSETSRRNCLNHNFFWLVSPAGSLQPSDGVKAWPDRQPASCQSSCDQWRESLFLLVMVMMEEQPVQCIAGLQLGCLAAAVSCSVAALSYSRSTERTTQAAQPCQLTLRHHRV